MRSKWRTRPATSHPSRRSSPSVSGLRGSVPRRNSSMLVNSSLSGSPSPVASGSSGLAARRSEKCSPCQVSQSEARPLPPDPLPLLPEPEPEPVPPVPGPPDPLLPPPDPALVSGVVPGSLGFRGLLPKIWTSSPSVNPSSSLSSFHKSVPSAYSNPFLNPSLSSSSNPSVRSFG